jgi:hypothetical protein
MLCREIIEWPAMSERSESNGGGGIRNPKVHLTTSEQTPNKNTTKPLQLQTHQEVTKSEIEQKRTLSIQNHNTSLHKKCATGVHQNEAVKKNLQPELTEIARLWPTLPDHIKAAIMALIKVR